MIEKTEDTTYLQTREWKEAVFVVSSWQIMSQRALLRDQSFKTFPSVSQLFLTGWVPFLQNTLLTTWYVLDTVSIHATPSRTLFQLRFHQLECPAYIQQPDLSPFTDTRLLPALVLLGCKNLNIPALRPPAALPPPWHTHTHTQTQCT